MHIAVQTDDFDVAKEYAHLRENNSQDGAIVFFSGLVREMNQGHGVTGLFLEHYPSMTEKSLQNIAQQASERWPLTHIRIIHRIGQLQVSDQIVFVATSSAHRESAFASCHFIMDYLKNQAPFWKKETREEGDEWVAALEKDETALEKWQEKGEK
ncbi:MAG: molybdopterin synthase catalytic subunit MoaE [Gammaproteobacteria bacterium]|nr:molybdopterin synthase catalytic subunit MoaE [Gammaproteobacteria bacterium]